MEVSPWEAVGSLLEVVCQVPFFDGEGKLASYSKNLNRPSDRTLPEWVRIVDYQFPERSQDLVNYVRVIFLDANLTRVDEPDQLLGTSQVTTGFFTQKEVLTCFWSDDHRQRAAGSRLVVKKSAQESIARLAFGFNIMTESYEQANEFHGKITVTVCVFVPVLATVALLEYLALAWGVIVMAITGFILWFPEFFVPYLPWWGFEAAEIIHFFEAFLPLSGAS